MVNINTHTSRPLDVTATQTPVKAGTSRQADNQVQLSSRSLGIAQGREVPVLSHETDSPRISADLRNRATDLVARFQAGTTLQLLTEQMNLEGELLKAHPSIPYVQLANTLHPDLHAHHSRENAAMDASQSALNEAFKRLHNQQGDLDTEEVKGALNKYADQLAEHLAIGDSRYDEVLSHPDLNAEQKGNIKRSHQAFMDHALVVGTAIPRMLDATVEKIASNVEHASGLLAASKAYINSLEPGEERSRAEDVSKQMQDSHDAYQSAREFMSKLKEEYQAPEDFKNALHNARLPAVLDQYTQQLSPENIRNAKTTAAAVQGLASAQHFGATRSGVESALAGASYFVRVLAAGTALGVAHEVVNNTTKPASQNLLETLGGQGVRLVKPTEVTAKPLRITTVDGARHERSGEEFAAKVKELEDLTQRFIEEQNKYKFGTPQGEGIAFLSFGVAQAGLEALVASGALPEKTVWALTLISLFAGAKMAWAQEGGKLHATVKDSKGRDLPTHLPTVAAGTLADRLGKTADASMKALDIRNSSPREAFLSKMFGAIQGVAISTASADAVRNLPHDAAGHIAKKLLVSAFGPTLTLSSFFAAMQTQPEATKANTSRLSLAVLNITQPDRNSLPHTTPAGTGARLAENAFHTARGILQVPSQAAVTIAATGAQLAIYAAAATASAGASALDSSVRAASSRLRTPNPQEDIELAERGEPRPV
jgi:effector protein HopM1